MHIGVLVEFSMALMSKLDGINRHSFNSFRLRVGEGYKGTLSLAHTLGLRVSRPCRCPEVSADLLVLLLRLTSLAYLM